MDTHKALAGSPADMDCAFSEKDMASPWPDKVVPINRWVKNKKPLIRTRTTRCTGYPETAALLGAPVVGRQNRGLLACLKQCKARARFSKCLFSRFLLNFASGKPIQAHSNQSKICAMRIKCAHC
ncbi:hypothetical protein ACQZ6J_25265 [Rhizobium sp. A37_96]